MKTTSVWAGVVLAVAAATARAGTGPGALFALAPAAGEEASWEGGSLFDEGSWTLQSYVSATTGDSNHGDVYAAHLGVGYFFVDGLSINVDLLGGLVDAGLISGDDDGVVGGFDLLFRWHFVRGGKWSLYMDGGAGFQLADTDWPSDSHHNFRPQFGMGFTYALTSRLNLMAGARYLHVSNAHTTDGNDGFDGAMIYAGAMWGF